MLQDPLRQARLETHGWTLLPALPDEVLTALHTQAVDLTDTLVRHALSSDVGFDELWGNADERYRRAVLPRIAQHLAVWLSQTFTDCRPVLYNFFVKRACAPGSAVLYHQDFAIVDERHGTAAVQLWIPLVDVNQDNGALILVDGSHRDTPAVRGHNYRCPSRHDSLTELPPGAVRPVLRAGEGVAFSNRTIHGSTANTTPLDRPAVGCILVPRDVSIVHWVQQGPHTAELWSLTDDDFLALQPGRVPPTARLVETVTD